MKVPCIGCERKTKYIGIECLNSICNICNRKESHPMSKVQKKKKLKL